MSASMVGATGWGRAPKLVRAGRRFRPRTQHQDRVPRRLSGTATPWFGTLELEPFVAVGG
jgi:hypothetical protein